MGVILRCEQAMQILSANMFPPNIIWIGLQLGKLLHKEKG